MSVNIETIPLYPTTGKVLKLFAYLTVDHWRCYFYLSITIVLNILEIIYIITSDNELKNLTVNLFLTVLWLATNVRMVVLISYRQQINEFLEEIYTMYMEIMKNGDETTKDMLKETTKSARSAGNLNLILGLCSCTGMFTTSMLSKGRALIFDMYLPFFDDQKYDTPCFEILYIVQFILLPSGCLMFMTFMNLMTALVFFNIFMCKVLQKELDDLKEVKAIKAVTLKLIKCVNFHNNIADYIGKINTLTTYVFSLEFVLFGALMCVLLFLLVIVKTIYEQTIMVAYIIMLFTQLAVSYFYANRLYFESVAVADAAYATNWYKYNGKIRMTLKLIIQRAQKPICLTLGNFHPMTLEVLTTLLNVSYSYFNILRNTMQ